VTAAGVVVAGNGLAAASRTMIESVLTMSLLRG
jgi:hypothetical protein